MSKPMTIDGEVITSEMVAVISRWRSEDHTTDQYRFLQEIQDYIIENMVEHSRDEKLKEIELLGLLSFLKKDIAVLLYPPK